MKKITHAKFYMYKKNVHMPTCQLIKLTQECSQGTSRRGTVKMEDNIDDLGLGLFSGYNEMLEAEYVLRARSILDEYVCPDTGVAIQTSQRHLLLGVRKLWSLSMEMRRLGDEIRQRIVTLPLLFIVILLHAVEQEYLAEEQGKQAADTQSAEMLLQLFYEIHDKLPAFKSKKSTRIVTRAIFTYLRYLITQFGAGEHVKPFSYLNNRVEGGRLKAPLRPGDMAVALMCMRHFRDKILPVFTRGEVQYQMTIKREVLDIMEPTREEQLEWVDILNTISAVMVAFGAIVFFVVLATQMSRVLNRVLEEKELEQRNALSRKPKTGPPNHQPNPENPDDDFSDKDDPNGVPPQPPKVDNPDNAAKDVEAALKSYLKDYKDKAQADANPSPPAPTEKKGLKGKESKKKTTTK